MCSLNSEAREQESLLGVAGAPPPGWQAKISLAQYGLASKRERFGRADANKIVICC